MFGSSLNRHTLKWYVVSHLDPLTLYLDQVYTVINDDIQTHYDVISSQAL